MGKKQMNSNEQSPWEFQVFFKKFSAIHGHLCLSLPSHFFLSVLPTKALYIYFLSHVCYMSHLSHSPSFDLPNNIWQKQKITKPPSQPQIFSSASCPQTPQVFFFFPLNLTDQGLYSYKISTIRVSWILIFVSGWQTGRPSNVIWMVASRSIFTIFNLNLLINVIFICSCCFQIFLNAPGFKMILSYFC